MGKIFWTTIFWALVIVIAGFYLKFMDQEVGQMVSDRIMTAQVDTEVVDGTLSGENLNPTQLILNGVTAMQLQLTDGLSGLNIKLDEAKALLENGTKAKAPVAPAPTPRLTGMNAIGTTGTK